MKRSIAWILLTLLLCLPLLSACGQQAPEAVPSENRSSDMDTASGVPADPADAAPSDTPTDEPQETADPYAQKLCDHRIQWQVETSDCEKGARLWPSCTLCGMEAEPMDLVSFAHSYTVITGVGSEGVTGKCAYCGKEAVLREKQNFADFDREESHFTYTLQEDGRAIITAYTGNAKKIYFPAELDGHRVVAIDLDGNMEWEQDLDSSGNGVVHIGGGITEIAIAPGIERIENGCFYKWVSLQEIYLMEGLRSIGESAFAKAAPQRVYLPDGLVSIGKDAFRRSSLDFLSIPASVVEIDTPISIAYWSDMREGFFVDQENPNYSSVNGALCSKDGETVYYRPDVLLAFSPTYIA